MPIRKVVVNNYRTLRDVCVELNPSLNVIVGDNETGKSTLLEAINLALTCQINRRPAAYELHPFLFNVAAVAEFISQHKAGNPVPPPAILIELYLAEDPLFAEFKGTNNSNRANVPGVKLSIELDPVFNDYYKEYISDPEKLTSVPVEFYHPVWMGFHNERLNIRTVPVRSSMIDPSAIPNTYAANKYVLEIIQDYLTREQQVGLALSYRKMKGTFLEDDAVSGINNELAKKAGVVSQKTLSVAMDTTTRASWETGVLPHLDEIPLTLVGKGEQNSVKIKLAIEAASASSVLLMEEPENHQSHSNLNKLITRIAERADGKQVIVTTHSSFVLNKLGVENVLMFNGQTAVSLDDLTPDTKDYFRKLPGYDTLRMILARRTILVEGPSDELVVQRAYKHKIGRLPIEDGIEIITVRALAFKRFLDIAKLLKIDVRVVTDNDGNVDALKEKYANYSDDESIQICYDDDINHKTLEPQLLKTNGREKLNSILGKSYATDEDLLKFMETNKTEVALKIFDSEKDITIPEYIENAIK